MSAAGTIQVEQQRKSLIWLPIKTKEDYRFIRGNGRYDDDVRLPNMFFTSILRSPYAHARIKNIDANGALKILGVIDVLTSEDVVKMSDPLPQMTVPPAST